MFQSTPQNRRLGVQIRTHFSTKTHSFQFGVTQGSPHTGLLIALTLIILLFIVTNVQAITPQEATDLVITNVIEPSPHADDLVGFFYRQNDSDPLVPPGYSISDFDSTFVEITSGNSYFFWLDNEPFSEWDHPATYVFVDGTNGNLTVYESESWVMINEEEYEDFNRLGNASPELFYGSYPVVQTSLSQNDDFPYQKPFEPLVGNSWALIVVGRNLDGARERDARLGDINRITDYLAGSEYGPQIPENAITMVTGANTMGATKEELCAAIEALMEGPRCDKFYFYYIGHGGSGNMVLKKDGQNRSKRYSYKDLACKLLDLNPKESCIVIEACHSGSAVRPMQKKTVKRNGKKEHLKGVIITSSSSKKTTKRELDGTPFHKGLQACGRDPLADFDGDGKITLYEAIAWARSLNPLLAGDSPQAEGLDDNKRVQFLKPQTGQSVTDNTTGGPLTYQVAKLRYKLRRGSSAGRDTVYCARRLYVSNPSNQTHRPTTAVSIICSRKGKPDTTLVTITPRLAKGERKCITKVPDDCKRMRVVAAGGSPNLDFPATEIAEDMRVSTYLPGDYLFHSTKVDIAEAGTYTNFITEGSLEWPLSLEPTHFEDNDTFDDQLILLRSDVPMDSVEGDVFSWFIDRTDEPSSQTITLEAMVCNPSPGTIDGGEGFFHQAIHAESGMHVNFGAVELSGSVVQLAGDPIAEFGPGSFFGMENSSLEADDDIPMTVAVRGGVQWDNSTIVAPESGLLFEDAFGEVVGGGVLGSNGDGLVMSGALDGLMLNFFTVEGSAGNALVFDNAPFTVLQNVEVLNSGGLDVVARNGSFAVLQDCTFDDNMVSVEPGSGMIRTWTTHLIVVDELDQPIPGVSVEIIDATGAPVFTGFTEPDGTVEYLTLDQYMNDGGNVTSTTPHNINLSILAEQNHLTFTADESQYLVIDFYDDLSSTPSEVVPKALLKNVMVAPNPFNPQTTFHFGLEQAGDVQFDLYDTRGQKVRTLVSGVRPAGVHEVRWDGRDDGGRAVSSGVYLARLREPGGIRAVKALLVR